MRDRIIAWLTRIILRVMSWLSLRQAQALGRLFGRLAWWSRGRAAKVTQINIATCYPHLDARAQRQLARDSLLHTGQLSTEMGIVWHWPVKAWRPLIRKVSGAQRIADALHEKRGVLVLAPHFGNWEMVNLFLGERFGLTAMYEPPNVATLDAMIRNARMRAGSILVPTTSTGIRELYRTLRKGKLVGLLPDQVPSQRSGVYAPFFGRPALTGILAHKVIRATEPLVVLGHARRLPDAAGFSLHFDVLPAVAAAEEPEAYAKALNHAIEELVALDPAQYQWEYKRFRRGPDDWDKLY